MAEPKVPNRRLTKLTVSLGLVVAVVAGSAVGVGTYTFVYAEGASYLTNDPAACANCHIMQPYYDGWQKSTHHAVAVCNDCHAPHDSFFHKYWVKAENGFWHSYAFTTGDFHEPIQIRGSNRRVTEQTCRSCHADVTDMIEHPALAGGQGDPDDRMSCIRCHGTVGHPDFN